MSNKKKKSSPKRPPESQKKPAKKSSHRLRTRHFSFILAGIAAILISIAFIFIWWAGGNSEQAVMNQIKDQKLILVRSGSLAISGFFEERKTNILFLSEIEAVRAGEEKEGREAIRELLDQLQNYPLASIVRVDKEGRSLWSDNLEHEKVAEGVDLADRDYFIWAKNQKRSGEVFVSQPLIARGGPAEGNWIVIMATPLFYQDKFNGLVFVSFPIEDLTEKYVIPLALSSRIYPFVVTQEGVVVASSESKAIGENVFQYAQQSGWQNKETYLEVVQRALSGEEGSAIHDYYLFGKEMQVLTTYTPIKVGSQLWSLVISSPYEEVNQGVTPFKVNQISGFIFGLLCLVILIFVFIAGIRVAQRDAFVNGFLDGRDGLKSVTVKK